MITAVGIVPGALAGRRRSVPQGNGSALLRVAKSNTLPYDVTFVDVCRRKSAAVLCQNFYEAACQVTRPVREIRIAFRHTPS